MFNQKGFTLIEMMIGIVFLMAFVMLFASGKAALEGTGNVSWGINGMTESRCIEGYKFIIGDGGQARQILDEFGKGVRCESVSVPNSKGM